MCRKCIRGGGISPEDALSHMQSDQLLIGLDSDNNVAGFSALAVETADNKGIEHTSLVYPCAYFAAAAIAKAYQGLGLYSSLNDRRLTFTEKSGLLNIYTRTQNPKVERGITSALERMQEQNRIRKFTLGRYVVRAVYDGMLTDERPQTKTISYDNLDYDRGDANIVSWQMIK